MSGPRKIRNRDLSDITKHSTELSNYIQQKYPQYWNMVVLIDPAQLRNPSVPSVGTGASLPQEILKLPHNGLPQMLRAAADTVEGFTTEGMGPFEPTGKN